MLVLTLVFVGPPVAAPPAYAHGGDETEEGYLLVQQAQAHLAHDTSHTGMDLAMEKIDDALATKDQEGVAVGEVRQAKRALAAGDIDSTRALLQASIQDALGSLPPATGEETGTTRVVPALPGRDGLGGRDWMFLTLSVVFVVVGVLLAYRFRPADTVHQLRSRLGGADTDSARIGHEQDRRP